MISNKQRFYGEKSAGLFRCCVSFLFLFIPYIGFAAEDIDNTLSTVSDQNLTCQNELADLYQRNYQQLIWFSGDQISLQAQQALEHLQKADQYGLTAEEYDVLNLEALLQELQIKPDEESLQWSFDLALTQSMMHFVSDLNRGRINPLRTGFDLVVSRKEIDLVNALLELSRAEDFDQTLNTYEPQFRAYTRLKQVLQEYRSIRSIYPIAPLIADKTIHEDEYYSDLENLKQRLILLGDLSSEEAQNSMMFDQIIVDAVKRFQKRHGLEADGVIGKKTFKQLNVSLEDRIDQITFALERLRWVNTPENGQHILVNIPAFELYALNVKDGIEAVEKKMNVIVGSALEKHDTPVFAADMQYIVFRPYWVVPYSITVKELLPKLRKDPYYLYTHRYEVVQGQTVITDLMANEEIFTGLRRGQYQLRQQPGDDNALGLIKFIFPNSNSVYLHDTSARNLFSRSRRDFSHGCIRVEKPLELAELILSKQFGWDLDQITKLTRDENNHKVLLNSPVPVHIFYTTALVRENGEVAFFEDIYEHDQKLRDILMLQHADHCDRPHNLQQTH